MKDSDAREIVALLGEIAMMDTSKSERRRAIMDGIGKLTEADAWLWFTSAHTVEGEQPVHTLVLHQGFDADQFGKMIEASELPDMARLTAPFFHDFNANRSQTTRLRQQIVGDDVFESSQVYEVWKEANIGPMMLSARPNEDGQVSMIGLYRNFDRPLFSERESRIAHIILSEIPGLHEDISSAELNGPVMDLPPRLRQVLNCQLQGFSRKEGAARLGISVHTLGEYLAELYRRFNVHSQTDLVRRFLDGDGGDVPLPS